MGEHKTEVIVKRCHSCLRTENLVPCGGNVDGACRNRNLLCPEHSKVKTILGKIQITVLAKRCRLGRSIEMVWQGNGAKTVPLLPRCDRAPGPESIPDFCDLNSQIIQSPNPVPPIPFACEKKLKVRFRAVGAMAVPVSAIVTRTPFKPERRLVSRQAENEATFPFAWHRMRC